MRWDDLEAGLQIAEGRWQRADNDDRKRIERLKAAASSSKACNDRPTPSAVRHLPSAICHLPFWYPA
jgi:hypothetical protein